MICTGTEQTIVIPTADDVNDADAIIMRIEQVRAIAKRLAKYRCVNQERIHKVIEPMLRAGQD